jgi:arabinoxylan arabinofuranohydrolase
MRKQAFNPYLPSFEYIPDGEPHVFEGRVYVYGSHDRFNGWAFCLGDYVTWSAPVDDLSDWRYEGVIYRKSQTPGAKKSYRMWAPDVTQGPDGKYYLYFFLGSQTYQDNAIHVAVSPSPKGPFSYLGKVHYEDGKPLGSKKGELKSFDPGVLSEDGKTYLYSGFSPKSWNPLIMGNRKPSPKGAMFYEIGSDMLTVKQGPLFIGVPGKRGAVGTPFEGHEFFEASSIRKFDGKYYFIYSSFLGHELCYAVSDFPDHGFAYGGTLVSIGDIGLHAKGTKDALNYTGNTHGSILRIQDRYYVFYHRQTNLKQFSRQACAEELKRGKDGRFLQAEVTSCGLNGGPLLGTGTYEARIACNLSSEKGTRFYFIFKNRLLHRKDPYFTQTGKDREENPDQYIANLRDGAWCAFKSFDLKNPSRLGITYSGNARGKLLVSAERNGKPIAELPLLPTHGKKAAAEAAVLPIQGVYPLYFRYEGKGHFDFFDFTLVA